MTSNNWVNHQTYLEKTFHFSSFLKAIEFMNDASKEIEILNHHPEWSNVYNKVHVVLRTHDAGNRITDLDYRLAEVLDNVFEKLQHPR